MSLVLGRRRGMVVGLLTLTLGALAGLGLTHSKGLLHWLSTRPKFASDADRAAVQRDAERALLFYESL